MGLKCVQIHSDGVGEGCKECVKITNVIKSQECTAGMMNPTLVTSCEKTKREQFMYSFLVSNVSEEIISTATRSSQHSNCITCKHLWQVVIT